MSFAESLDGNIGELMNAYERLIMDVIRGDQTLFMRNDEVEAAWEWIDSILDAGRSDQNQVYFYSPGTDGPKAAETLVEQDGRKWREICQ